MAKKLWGGRFGKKTDPLVEKFTRSIQYDYKLAEYDLLGSIAHVQVLRKSRYLTPSEAKTLTKGLEAILSSVKKGTFKPDHACEDIHTDIQNKLASRAGALAMKLHTARSRNDQVVFAVKLYSKAALKTLIGDISKLSAVISALAAKNKNIIMPGFTHMQHAQPVYLKKYLGAYLEMLKRDAERLKHVSENIKPTLGAGALAGTPISAKFYAGYATSNSLDAVSDRDFVLDILGALSITGMHLSRLAEDLIIWATKEFGFVEIDEAFCTGSSLMPQKKNADFLELVRGYTGRLYGNLMSVLATMKGLPLTYNRDMQLDKEPLFSSFEIVSAELKIFQGLVKSLEFNKERIAAQLKDEALYATDLLYYLVRKGEPFASAHAIVGKIVKYSLDNGVLIKNMTQDQLKKFSSKIKKGEIKKLFDPKVSVESKKSVKR
ncbi:MAG: argininosuccinate lyase [Candidatus Omnitrophica bacterium]|nr:argininosuccinate lyase [Candidatus Omnitrophota bacterium]